MLEWSRYDVIGLAKEVQPYPNRSLSARALAALQGPRSSSHSTDIQNSFR